MALSTHIFHCTTGKGIKLLISGLQVSMLQRAVAAGLVETDTCVHRARQMLQQPEYLGWLSSFLGRTDPALIHGGTFEMHLRKMKIGPVLEAVQLQFEASYQMQSPVMIFIYQFTYPCAWLRKCTQAACSECCLQTSASPAVAMNRWTCSIESCRI